MFDARVKTTDLRLSLCHRFKNGAFALLYLDPSLNSGERICVGVVIRFGGVTQIVTVSSLERLTALYGGPIPGVQFRLDCAIADLQQHLEEHDFDKVADWTCRLGVSVGKPTEAMAGSVGNLVDFALYRQSVLYRRGINKAGDRPWGAARVVVPTPNGCFSNSQSLVGETHDSVSDVSCSVTPSQ